ncbi:LacI family DNA-binding transcriptional regulator [Demequina aurantiaca]|uniref:LacI family DNA-binding transcriptional regulator n=1 Tax=Demequina aurantiaca TaxID=676200 RepID=UPI0007842687|nr:LacI family DNA-binding transcriptional regulator [Demequina aurantiaca]
MPTGDTRTTIAEIAALAGVSAPTVSKVLNGRGGIAPETRDRIQELLAQNGYRRRGTTKRQPVGLIDFVIRDIDSIWAMPLLKGAEEEVARAGVNLVLMSTHGRRVGNKHWIQQLASRRTDAVVLVVSELQPGAEEELSRLNTPVVLVDPVGSTTTNIPAIAATNWAGGLAATEHLIELGHTRIGMVTGPEDVMCARDRLDGYRAALTRAGINVDHELEVYGDFQLPSGVAGAAKLLSLAQPPTAIFAGSDLQAAGIYEEAQRRGMSIPQDLSVVGFDDVLVSEWITPRLTTVRQPLEQMAREAIRTAMALAHDDTAPQPRVELATSLVVRNSTAPPRTLSD